MKYNDLKDFLKKNPYCFRTENEKKREFDQRVINSERKPIMFVEAPGKYRNS